MGKKDTLKSIDKVALYNEWLHCRQGFDLISNTARAYDVHYADIRLLIRDVEDELIVSHFGAMSNHLLRALQKLVDRNYRHKASLYTSVADILKGLPMKTDSDLLKEEGFGIACLKEFRKITGTGSHITHYADIQEVIIKAMLNLMDGWKLSKTDLAQIVGVDASVLSRLDKTTAFEPHKVSGQLALMLIRVYRGLSSLSGNRLSLHQNWLRAHNRAFNGTPLDTMKTPEGLARVANYIDGGNNGA